MDSKPRYGENGKAVIKPQKQLWFGFQGTCLLTSE